MLWMKKKAVTHWGYLCYLVVAWGKLNTKDKSADWLKSHSEARDNLVQGINLPDYMGAQTMVEKAPWKVWRVAEKGYTREQLLSMLGEA